MEKHLIINADDFGTSVGVNRGILRSHTHGVVTSTSLMVNGCAVHEAVSMSRDHPALSIGLHWDVEGEGEPFIDTEDLAAVRDEFWRQFDEFHRLMGRMPTHVDSHHHLHREPHLMPLFRELVEPLGIPLRDGGGVRFIGGFYAQWEWLVTDLDHVSVPALQTILLEEVAEGWTELSCHPGFPSPDFTSVYLTERVAEVETLTDPRIRKTINESGIRLSSYADYAAPRK